MAIPTSLQTLVASWSSYYGDHQAVSVVVRFLHLASTVVGGGTAISLDRLVLRAIRRDGAARRALLDELRGSHRVVVPALTVVALTGVLMTAADLDTFLGSTLYWTKLAFVALLVVNGGLLLAAESVATRASGQRWGRLVGVSVLSITLWLTTLLVGTWLTVAA